MADPMKKPSLALVISAGKKAAAGDGDDTEESDADEAGEGYAAAVDEAFDAIKSDDREAFAAAFKAAVMSCK